MRKPLLAAVAVAVISLCAIVATLSTSGASLVGAVSTPTVAPSAVPQFFQDTGRLGSPWQACGAYDGYSPSNCGGGAAVGSDHPGSYHP